MAEVQLAYRHFNGAVEGFVGYGFGKQSAEDDCIQQMQFKVRLIQDSRPNSAFDPKRIIWSEKEVTTEEMEIIRNNWASGERYNPNGSLVARSQLRGRATTGVD